MIALRSPHLESGARDERHATFDVAMDQDFGQWTVNGKPISGRVSRVIEDMFGRWSRGEDYSALGGWGSPSCDFCQKSFRRVCFDEEGDSNARRDARAYVVLTCRYCGHWKWLLSESSMQCMDPPIFGVASSVAARFEAHLPEGCSSELSQVLRRDHRSWQSVNPGRFERFVRDVFRANHTGCEVRHVGGPGDGGVDVLLVDDNKRRWLIQVKRRVYPSRPERFSTIQSILGTLALEGERHGMVVTTADAFSHYAKRASARAASRGYIVELIDRGMLDRMLGRLIPVAPWRAAYTHTVFARIAADARAVIEEALQPEALDLFET